MSTPEHNSPYSFDEYRQVRDQSKFLADDQFLSAVIATYAPQLTAEAREDLARFDTKISSDWRPTAEVVGQPDNAPHMRHFDPYNNRIDRIKRPAEVLKMEKEVFAEAMFADDADPWSTCIKIFLMSQLGFS